MIIGGSQSDSSTDVDLIVRGNLRVNGDLSIPNILQLGSNLGTTTIFPLFLDERLVFSNFYIDGVGYVLAINPLAVLRNANAKDSYSSKIAAEVSSLGKENAFDSVFIPSELVVDGRIGSPSLSFVDDLTTDRDRIDRGGYVCVDRNGRMYRSNLEPCPSTCEPGMSC